MPPRCSPHDLSQHELTWLAETFRLLGSGGLGYSLVGAATPERLHSLANAIRQQIRERI